VKTRGGGIQPERPSTPERVLIDVRGNRKDREREGENESQDRKTIRKGYRAAKERSGAGLFRDLSQGLTTDWAGPEGKNTARGEL